MADKKISALTGATTPLAGTEVLPIVQSGATVKVAVSDLTAGRAISATQLTVTTGNRIVANGQGVDFSATPGTGTSELFADYEEGTFTPTIAGNTTAGTNTYTTQVGRYTKVGDTVYVQISIVINAMGTAGNAGAGYTTITGLPFTPGGSDQIGFSIGWLALVTFLNTPSCYGVGGATYLTLRELQTATYGSTVSIANVADGAYISVAGSYKV